MTETISMTDEPAQLDSPPVREPVSPVKKGAFPAKKAVDWQAVKQDWVTYGLPAKQVAARYGITVPHIYTVSRRQGWQRIKGPVGKAAAKAVKEAAKQVVARVACQAVPAVEQAVREWQERTLRLAETARSKVGQHLSTEQDPEELKTSVATLDTVDKVGRRTLGLDREVGDAGSARVAVAVRLELLGLGESSLSASATTLDVAPAGQLGEGEPA